VNIVYVLIQNFITFKYIFGKTSVVTSNYYQVSSNIFVTLPP